MSHDFIEQALARLSVDTELVALRAENNRLEADVACWKANCHSLASANTDLRKAGDALVSVGEKMRKMIGDHYWTLEFDRVKTDWHQAARNESQTK